MEQQKEYYAFISYKREDEKWAKWLQNKLEHYKFPTNLNGRTDLPKNIRPTFRDVTDMKPGLLAEEIDNALRNSQWLIVVCSPRSAKSPWVCKEAQTFIDLGRADHIIPFVIEGNPFSKDTATECYPDALRNLTGSKELLAANINEMGRDAAAIKVVARMFNLRFDALWQRYEREIRKKRRWGFSVAIIAILCISCIANWMYWQKRQTELANLKKMEYQSRAVAEKALELVDDGDSYLARKLLLEVMSGSGSNPNRPYTVETERAMIKAYQSDEGFFTGHKEGVYSVAFSPDGKMLASISDDKCIKIWDVNTGECKDSLNIRHWGRSLAFSPDGKKILSTSIDSIIQVWNLKDKTFTELTGHSAYVFSASYCHNGRYIVSASEDKTVKIWDSITNKCILTFRGHNRSVYHASFSNDDKYIASASFDKTIRIWNLSTGKCVDTLYGHDDVVSSVSFNPSDNQLVSSSWDNTIKIWDISNIGKSFCINTLSGHTGDVRFACYNPDGKYIVSAGEDNTVRIWNAFDGKMEDIFAGHTKLVNHVCFNPNGTLVASASWDDRVHLWEWGKSKNYCKYLIKSETPSNYVDNPEKRVISPDGKSFVTSNYNKIFIWNIVSGDRLQTLTGNSKLITCTNFSSDGKFLVSASEYESVIRIWNVKDGTCVDSIDSEEKGIKEARLSSNGKYLVSIAPQIYMLWDVKSKALLYKKKSPRYVSVKSMAISPNNRLFAIAYNNGLIELCNLNSGKLIHSFTGHNDRVDKITFSPNNRYLSSTSADGTIRVWDVNNGECVKLFKAHNKWGYFVSFSHNGEKIVSAGVDEEICICDINTNEVITFKGERGSNFNSVFFSPDDKRLLLSTMNIVYLLDTYSGKVLHKIRKNSLSGYIQTAEFCPNGNILIVGTDYFGLYGEFPSYQKLIDETQERFKANPLTPEERKFYLEYD